MTVQSLVGLGVYSDDPAAPLAFFRDQLGVPLALHNHGPVKPHHEALIGGTHIALFKGKPRLVPVFHVADLAGTLAVAEARGAVRAYGPAELGEGKRIAALAGLDGFEIRLIEIDG